MRDSPDLYPLCLAARLLGGAGAGVSPDSEKEKPGFMFGAVIVILCSAAHLVTTLWPAANEAELYNHWLLTALPLFSLFWDWSGRQPFSEVVHCGTWSGKKEVQSAKPIQQFYANYELFHAIPIGGHHSLNRGYQFLCYIFVAGLPLIISPISLDC